MASYGQDDSSSFNQVDWLISEIYKEVRGKDVDWADDIIGKLADALYDGQPMRMLIILDEWQADRYLSSRFTEQLQDAIEQYAYEIQSYGI